jgi:hypothetical protein
MKRLEISDLSSKIDNTQGKPQTATTALKTVNATTSLFVSANASTGDIINDCALLDVFRRLIQPKLIPSIDIDYVAELVAHIVLQLSWSIDCDVFLKLAPSMPDKKRKYNQIGGNPFTHILVFFKRHLSIRRSRVAPEAITTSIYKKPLRSRVASPQPMIHRQEQPITRLQLPPRTHVSNLPQSLDITPGDPDPETLPGYIHSDNPLFDIQVESLYSDLLKNRNRYSKDRGLCLQNDKHTISETLKTILSSPPGPSGAGATQSIVDLPEGVIQNIFDTLFDEVYNGFSSEEYKKTFTHRIATIINTSSSSKVFHEALVRRLDIEKQKHKEVSDLDEMYANLSFNLRKTLSVLRRAQKAGTNSPDQLAFIPKIKGSVDTIQSDLKQIADKMHTLKSQMESRLDNTYVQQEIHAAIEQVGIVASLINDFTVVPQLNIEEAKNKVKETIVAVSNYGVNVLGDYYKLKSFIDGRNKFIQFASAFANTCFTFSRCLETYKNEESIELVFGIEPGCTIILKKSSQSLFKCKLQYVAVSKTNHDETEVHGCTFDLNDNLDKHKDRSLTSQINVLTRSVLRFFERPAVKEAEQVHQGFSSVLHRYILRNQLKLTLFIKSGTEELNKTLYEEVSKLSNHVSVNSLLVSKIDTQNAPNEFYYYSDTEDEEIGYEGGAMQYATVLGRKRKVRKGKRGALYVFIKCEQVPLQKAMKMHLTYLKRKEKEKTRTREKSKN